MKKALIIALFLPAMLRAAELSIENPPSAQDRAAGIRKEKARLEKSNAFLQQELDRADADALAQTGNMGCLPFWKVFFKGKPQTQIVDTINKAVRADDQKLVKKLISKRGANGHGSDGQTPLHVAINPEIVRLLLERKADINTLNCYGYSALICRCLDLQDPTVVNDGTDRAIACAQILLNQPEIDVNVQDASGATALIGFVRSGHFKLKSIALVAALIERGADPYINDEYQQNVYNLLHTRLLSHAWSRDTLTIARGILHACVTQRKAVFEAVLGKTNLTPDPAGIVIKYMWGNLDVLLHKVEDLKIEEDIDSRCRCVDSWRPL